MRAAHSPADFLADPIGRYVAGRAFVVWAYSPKLVGRAYFGRIEVADQAPLEELSALFRNPALAPPYRALLDGSRLETLDSRGYELLARYLAHWPEMAPKVERVAIVRPGGLASAVSAGIFHETVAPTAQAALFQTPAEAHAWLELTAKQIAAIEDAVRAADVPPLLRELRRYLADHLRDAALEPAARAVASSPRSLQRALADRDTSFRAELDRARVAAAEELLDGDAKIEAIAAAVGCKSPSVFYDLFRRHVGMTPQQFRERKK
jgi:AraC-like DNA-binding protein